jgi:hypothetical protein
MRTTKQESDSPLSGKEDANISRFIRECFSEMIDPSAQVSESAMATLMDHYLEAPVIAAPPTAADATSVLAHVYREISSQAGHSIKKCLLDPKTPISVLTAIKDRHQRTAKKCPSEADQRVATVVYFGAIASALIFHHEKVTSYSNARLQQALGKLLDRPWIDPEVKGLLGKAQKVLREPADAR